MLKLLARLVTEKELILNYLISLFVFPSFAISTLRRFFQKATGYLSASQWSSAVLELKDLLSRLK